MARDFDPASASESLADTDFFSSLREETRFLIVRHGQSEGNARGIVQGRLDLPLDSTGRFQALELGRWMAGIVGAGHPRAALFSSPLRRAAETAELIRAALDSAREESEPSLQRIEDPLLSELDTGPFTGLSMEEARKLHPESYAAFERESWDGVPGAESSEALFARAIEAWELLRSSALGGSRLVIAVTHGGFIQWLVKATLGSHRWMPLLPVSNCGVSELVVTPRDARGAVLLVWKRIDWRPPSVEAAVPPLF
jgi:broad specificity phosphatase PhoE